MLRAVIIEAGINADYYRGYLLSVSLFRHTSLLYEQTSRIIRPVIHGLYHHRLSVVFNEPVNARWQTRNKPVYKSCTYMSRAEADSGIKLKLSVPT